MTTLKTIGRSRSCANGLTSEDDSTKLNFTIELADNSNEESFLADCFFGGTYGYHYENLESVDGKIMLSANITGDSADLGSAYMRIWRYHLLSESNLDDETIEFSVSLLPAYIDNENLVQNNIALDSTVGGTAEMVTSQYMWTPDPSSTIRDITVKATPEEGYVFVEWQNDYRFVSNDAEYTFSVEGDFGIELKAIFELDI